MKHSDALVDNTKKLKESRTLAVEEKRSAATKKENEYKKTLEFIKERVNKRALLMEQVPKNKYKNLEKMKVLKKFNKVLEDANISGKDDILNKDDQNMIQDAKHLEEKGLL